ncbi:MAG: hypothetical protein WCM93_08045 [Bacteroidota bacterium]
MPPGHQDTRPHKVLIFIRNFLVNGEALNEVKLGGLVAWWQKRLLGL